VTNARRKSRYWDRKVRGLCVECGKPAGETVRCERHRAMLVGRRRAA
jgi:hypothetical protein